jgi:hypothetical protein
MQTVTREDVLATIAALPADKLAEVYDFARFIVHRDTVVTEAEPTEEELAAEDAVWDAAFAKTTPEQLEQLHERIRNSPSLPMFDEAGRWLVDDYTDEDFARAKGA